MDEQIRVSGDPGWDKEALWRPWFLVPVLARAYEAAEPLVKRRATDTVVWLALDVEGEVSTVRVSIVVDDEHDTESDVSVVIVNDERDGDAVRLTFMPHYDGEDWQPQAFDPQWENNPEGI
jgi:hypothetical protein